MDGPEITRWKVQSEFQYMRLLMRQAQTAMKEGRLAELEEIAPELVAAATTLTSYVEERRTCP